MAALLLVALLTALPGNSPAQVQVPQPRFPDAPPAPSRSLTHKRAPGGSPAAEAAASAIPARPASPASTFRQQGNFWQQGGDPGPALGNPRGSQGRSSAPSNPTPSNPAPSERPLPAAAHHASPADSPGAPRTPEPPQAAARLRWSGQQAVPAQVQAVSGSQPLNSRQAESPMGRVGNWRAPQDRTGARRWTLPGAESGWSRRGDGLPVDPQPPAGPRLTGPANQPDLRIALAPGRSLREPAEEVGGASSSQAPRGAGGLSGEPLPAIRLGTPQFDDAAPETPRVSSRWQHSSAPDLQAPAAPQRSAATGAGQPATADQRDPQTDSLEQLDPLGELDLPELRQRERCERVYNGRDCCELEEQCRRVHELLNSSSIRNVSLDITPRFRPYDDRRESVLKERLQRAPSRTWRDRSGQVLAEGKMVNFAQGKIHVRDQHSGQVRAVRYDQLSLDDTCFATAWWGIPSECFLEGEYQSRSFTPSTFTWKASGLSYHPLYFQDVQLERYGHATHPALQPLLSGAHFFVNIAVLPYRMGINPPNECQYPLGFYRPGNCAPWLLPPIPLSLRGALVQGGAATGAVFLLP